MPRSSKVSLSPRSFPPAATGASHTEEATPAASADARQRVPTGLGLAAADLRVGDSRSGVIPARRVGAVSQLREGNPILLTDSYKLSHYRQYPPKTTYVTAYFESRAGARFPRTVFFGLQQLLSKIDKPITQSDIDEADEISHLHLGPGVFNRAGWQHILDVHGGFLPLSIKAVPEGSAVPTGNALMTVVNTDPSCYWLPNYMETLLTHVWYPSTVASQSHEMKKVIFNYLVETGADTSSIDLKLHDFGFRGVSSVETAGIGAAAHLLSFQGTDTLAGILTQRNHYGAEMAGFSVPAAEHSTITSWTRARELDAYRNMLDQYPTGPVAIVSDSYDLEHACRTLYGEELRAKILAREGVTVIRPDSGDPATMVLRVHDILGERFGFTLNAKGYRELNPKVAILQGDGIDVDSIDKILRTLKEGGWSTGALALGSGGGLLQKMNRDTQKFAFKASAAMIDGEWVDVYKDPATDKGKRSKRGQLKLVIDDEGSYQSLRESERPELPDQLREVFRDGRVLVRDDLSTIRRRLARSW